MCEASGRSYCEVDYIATPPIILCMRDKASPLRALVHWLLLLCLACAAARHGDLLEASLKGDMAAVIRLIDEGNKPNVVDQQGRTPLHASALGGHRQVVVQLLSSGANPEVADAAGVVNCTRLGREPRRPWRARPSRRRLRKVHATPGHPLCGLVGYSE